MRNFESTLLRARTKTSLKHYALVKRRACSPSATSVVSPTTVNKKVLVTDNDLRLFSVGSMRELNGRKGKSSKHYSKKVKMMSSVATSAASPSFPHRHALNVVLHSTTTSMTTLFKL
ncbi:hypothetical protein GQ600_2107 [Phytophthora cactorum]|nr:hypothetical protein GQ600_2107 [Phytophthora cactorum]